MRRSMVCVFEQRLRQALAIHQYDVIVQLEPAGGDQIDGLRVNPMLELENARLQALLIVSSMHAEARLTDHRASIQLVGNKVHTAAMLTVTSKQHVAMGVQSLVLGQQRGMNVQQSP